jgi:hypothetical protein
MAKQCSLSLILGAFLGLALTGFAAAGPIASKDDDVVSSRQADLAQVRDVLARDEVAKALSSRGLSPPEVERRLAQLSEEDLRSLSANLSQIQAAGQVPNYIWILLAILIIVLIITKI